MSELMLDPEEIAGWWSEADDKPRRMAEIAVAALRERAANGDVNAEVVLNDWTMAGAIQRLKRPRLALRQVMLPRVSSSGMKDAALPPAVSLRTSDGQQLIAWDTLTYADFRRWLDGYRQQYRSRAKALQVYDQLDAVWADHQDLMGSEALRLIGVDPASQEQAA